MQSFVVRKSRALVLVPSLSSHPRRSLHLSRPTLALKKSTADLDKELFGDIGYSPDEKSKKNMDDADESTQTAADKRGRKKKTESTESSNLAALSEKPSASESDKDIARNLDNIEREIFGTEKSERKSTNLPPPPLPKSSFGERRGRSVERSSSERSRDYGGNRASDRYGSDRYGSGSKFGGNRSSDRYEGGDSFDSSRRYGDNFSARGPSESLGSRLKKPDFETEKFEAVKTTYTPHPKVAEMTPQQVAQWRKEHHFKVEGEGHAPILEFDYLPADPRAVSYLKDNYPAPTPIQAQSWPIALGGSDLIGRAQTGSGKTISFLLPLLEHVKAQLKAGLNPHYGPCAVILAPTRELALQINEELQKLGAVYRLKSAVVHGGSGNRNYQTRSLQRGPAVVVATPGRLIDFLEESVTSLKQTTFVVLDEADRMLDMGFEDQVRSILSQVRPDRQTLMFSATWPREVANLAKEFLTEPTSITIGSEELHANPDVTQKIVLCAPFDRLRLLEEVFERNPTSKILVFAGSKSNCDFLGEHLYKNHREIKFAVLHGDKSQQQRQNIIEDFKTGYLTTVIATDVAARGLDVKDIDLVVNYEFPPTIEDYIHRIGRTGRAGKTGVALSFFTPAYHRLTKELIHCLKTAKQEIPKDLLNLLQDQKKESQAQRSSGRTRMTRGGAGARGGFSGRGGKSKPKSDSDRYGDRFGRKKKPDEE